jgi:hypothetical protein
MASDATKRVPPSTRAAESESQKRSSPAGLTTRTLGSRETTLADAEDGNGRSSACDLGGSSEGWEDAGGDSGKT